MSTISPALDLAVPGVPRLIWADAATGDTINPFILSQQYGLAAGVQVVGTFGGATVTIEISNDGTNWVTAKDLFNVNTVFTATGYAELTLSAAYIRPKITGGTGDSLTVIATLRGSNAL